MINFLPLKHNNYSLSEFYRKIENGFFGNSFDYPFSRLRYFYLNRSSLSERYNSQNTFLEYLSLDETKIVRFDMFKNIFLRGDYFYLIAYHYFLNDTNYNFINKKEGIMTIPHPNDRDKTKNISFFKELYDQLKREMDIEKSSLRQEFVLTEYKFEYANILVEYLFRDYFEFENATLKETNQFVKYSFIIKEIYIEIFKYIHSNFIDYLSDSNFKKLLNIVYPSKKEELSFQFKNQRNFRNGLTKEAREEVINSILTNLINYGFIPDNTSYQQIDDLFNNRRRERNKIIWLRNLTELKTLYKVLNDNNYILPSKNRHWKILSDYFILKNDINIEPKDLQEIKFSKKITSIMALESSFSILNSIVSVM